MKKWEDLAESLRNEPAILGPRISAHKLKILHDSGLAVAEEEDGRIIVFGALWPTQEDFFLEAGSFWVHFSHRNRKKSSGMFEKLLELIPPDNTAILVTYIPKVVHLLQKAGWTEATVNTWDSIPFSVSCGPCNLVADELKRCCTCKATEKCRLFYSNGSRKTPG